MTLPNDTPAPHAVDPPKAALTAAFAFLGLLVGTLLAFSAQSLAQAVLAALFAFFGGSILQIMATRTRAFQLAAALATLALSLGTIAGVYSASQPRTAGQAFLKKQGPRPMRSPNLR